MGFSRDHGGAGDARVPPAQPLALGSVLTLSGLFLSLAGPGPALLASTVSRLSSALSPGPAHLQGPDKTPHTVKIEPHTVKKTARVFF